MQLKQFYFTALLFDIGQSEWQQFHTGSITKTCVVGDGGKHSRRLGESARWTTVESWRTTGRRLLYFALNQRRLASLLSRPYDAFSLPFALVKSIKEGY